MALVGGEVDVSVVDGLEEVEGLSVAFEGVECEVVPGVDSISEPLEAASESAPSAATIWPSSVMKNAALRGGGTVGWCHCSSLVLSR